jgi:protein PhnA
VLKPGAYAHPLAMPGIARGNGGTSGTSARAAERASCRTSSSMGARQLVTLCLKHHHFREKTGMDVKDSNGNKLSDGDSVQVIKDLKVKGTSVTLKRGTVIKNIRLTDDEEQVECNADKVKGLVLKTCFLKKV